MDALSFALKRIFAPQTRHTFFRGKQNRTLKPLNAPGKLASRAKRGAAAHSSLEDCVKFGRKSEEHELPSSFTGLLRIREAFQVRIGIAQWQRGEDPRNKSLLL